MKKIVFSIVLTLVLVALLSGNANAQAYNPYYAMYRGYGYMPVANGYYIGWIECGFAHGQGYGYYYDMVTGWTSYQGGFYQGCFHGEGQMLCAYGYIAGVWNMNTFVRQINVSENQIQQSYNNMMEQSQHYAPQNSNTITLPPGTEIKEIDSSSELGSKLLGKMRK